MKKILKGAYTAFINFVAPLLILVLLLSAIIAAFVFCGLLILRSGPPEEPISHKGVSQAVNYTVIPDTTAADAWQGSVQPSTQEDWAKAYQDFWWVYQGTQN